MVFDLGARIGEQNASKTRSEALGTPRASFSLTLPHLISFWHAIGVHLLTYEACLRPCWNYASGLKPSVRSLNHGGARHALARGQQQDD